MVVFPNAKINLGLFILRKREDGFHDIESLFYPIVLSDILEVVEDESSSTVSFTSTGIPIPGTAQENICLKAYELLKQDYLLPGIKIHLHKIIPIGAGLGGGSSDAAFFLKLMNEKFRLNLTPEQFLNYASKLGSDCSFFIENSPAFAEQRGEKLSKAEVSLKGYYLLLVYPGIHVSTVRAYAGVVPKKRSISLIQQMAKTKIEDWKNNICNDFELSVFPEFPEISLLKDKMYEIGAVYASMSGSGSSVYGIFNRILTDTDLEKFNKHYTWVQPL